MIEKEIISQKNILIVKIITDFKDAYMQIAWPVGSNLEINQADYIKGGIIKKFTAGHGIQLELWASDVKPLSGYKETIYKEIEKFEL
jgi:hypothetical protein